MSICRPFCSKAITKPACVNKHPSVLLNCANRPNLTSENVLRTPNRITFVLNHNYIVLVNNQSKRATILTNHRPKMSKTPSAFILTWDRHLYNIIGGRIRLSTLSKPRETSRSCSLHPAKVFFFPTPVLCVSMEGISP